MKKFVLFGLVAMLAMGASTTFAATGVEFQTINDTLVNWIQGYLGRIIVLVLIGVGIVAGIARQSIMAFAVGIGAGLGLNAIPTVLDNMMAATLPLS